MLAAGLCAAAIFAVGGLGVAQPKAAPHGVPVIIEVSADDVRFARDEGKAYARGHVMVIIRRRDDPSQWVKLQAADVTSDLRTGAFEAARGVRMETEMGVFAGAAVRYDPRDGRILMERGCAAAPLSGPGGVGQGRAYFCGAELGRRGHVIYVFRGRLTTCDRAHPHWSVTAREITYDTRKGDLKIRGGKLHLYGLTIPLISPLTIPVKPRKGGKRRFFTNVGYSSRDGIYFPHYFVLSGAEKNTQLTTSFRVSMKRGWVGNITAYHPSPRHEWHLTYARKEGRYDNLDDYVALDRAPELSFTNHFITRDSEQANTDYFALTLSGGYFREVDDDGHKHTAGRFQVRLQRDFHTDQRAKLDGHWYGWAGWWNKYHTGDDYGVLRVYYGRGRRLSDRLAAALTGTYHVFGGHHPLLLDNPDIRTELTPEIDWDITDKWRLRFSARYDVNLGTFRDYSIQLDRQVHCLTWYVRYRDLGNSIVVGLNLSGLTGGTRPYKARPEPPELREGEFPALASPVTGGQDNQPAAKSQGRGGK